MSDFEVEKAILVSLLGPANEPTIGRHVIIGWGPRIGRMCNSIAVCNQNSRWSILDPYNRNLAHDFATVVKVVSSPEFREKHRLPALESDDG